MQEFATLSIGPRAYRAQQGRHDFSILAFHDCMWVVDAAGNPVSERWSDPG
jgi:hypothetical protein